MEDVPDPQVPERARRRTYTAKYKAEVLAEYEAVTYRCGNPVDARTPATGCETC